VISVEEALSLVGDATRNRVEVVTRDDLDEDERVKFDYLDATIESGVHTNFSSGAVGMFDIKIPADSTSLRIINALTHHWESEGWMTGVFIAEASGDIVTLFQIVFAPASAGTIVAARSAESTVRIIGSRNRGGIARDIRVLQAQIQAAGFGVEVSDPDRPISGRVSVQFHLENVAPDALPLSDRNVIIPNPELWAGGLEAVEVWCKTSHATRVFEDLGASPKFIGWSSLDRYDATVPREKTFLHVCGSSHRKGTQALVRAWREDWPTLTVVCQPAPWWKDLGECAWIDEPFVPNVRVIRSHVSDDLLRELQNRSVFHIYPSLYEGYGHALWEGLSCGALVIVPDGEPFVGMTGLLSWMKATRGKPSSNTLIYDRDVAPVAVADAVENALRLENVNDYRRDARDAWVTQSRSFRAGIAKAMAA
jgi:hypothetical protein